MIRFKCGNCQNVVAVTSVSPGGDQIACPNCGNMMLLNAPKAVMARPAVLKPKQVSDDDDVIDLQQVNSPAPVVRPVIIAKVASAPGVAPANYQPAPSTRNNEDLAPRSPRPRSKKKARKNNLPLFIGAGVVLAVLLVAGILLINALNKVDVKPAIIALNKEDKPSTKKKFNEDSSTENSTPSETLKARDNNSGNSASKPERKAPASIEPERNDSNQSGNKDEANSASANNSDPGDKTTDTVQPPSFAGSSDGSGADVYPYVLKSSTFIIALSKNGRSVGAGSGSLIDVKNRLVLTNHHVAGDASKIAVFFPNYDSKGKLIAEKRMFMEQFRNRSNKVIEATVMATNPTCDLCILQLTRLPDGVEALPFAKQSCRIGQRVHSIGNPASSGALWVYAPGVVRQTYHTTWNTLNEDRSINTHTADVIETQSPTNHGDSGGPLVNDRGELVGVTHGGKTDGLSSISLFIDLAEVKRFAESASQKRFNTEFVSANRAPLSVAGSASNTGSGMSGSLPDLVKALENTATRAKAAEALGLMGEKARDAIPSLLKHLADQDEFVQRTTMTALTKIGNPSKTDLPIMVAALSDSNVNMRRYAATTLEKMGTDARSVSNELVAAIRDMDPVVRQSAARAVGLFGRDMKEIAKAPLEDLLKDADKDNRLAAAEGLSNIYGAAGDLDGMMRMLKHKDTDIRVYAVRASIKLGKNAKLLLNDLLSMAKEDTGETRKAVIKVLGQLEYNDAKPGLSLIIDAVKNGDKDTRQACLQALGNLGKDVQPAMVSAVKDCMKENELKPACIDTLKKFAPNSKSSVVLLVELVKDEDSNIADAAANAIVDLGPAASGAVGELIKLMDISGNRVTQADEQRVTKYANLLAKIGKTAIPTLRRGLASRSITRWGCVKALGEIGPPAREAVRDLQLLIQQEPNEFIRRDIEEAVRKILNQ
ncbi:MAG: HEAT repeat domain-containing protein [Gemmatales bacterium]